MTAIPAPAKPTPAKFQDPYFTAQGKKRAWVSLKTLSTLWFNTGTLCNLACQNCYIESSPSNDKLVYLSLQEVDQFLDEITTENYATTQIGITGGEPFMNPEIIPIMESILKRGYHLLLLTNAMRPMMKCAQALKKLQRDYHAQITLRISIDHFDQSLHQEERGPRSWQPMLTGLTWLAKEKFNINIAGRTRWQENETDLRNGFATLFAQHHIQLDAFDRHQLVLFPEMDMQKDVSEISTECWDILKVNPDDMMCASSRMVVKIKGDDTPSVMACTLLAYDSNFNMGKTLRESFKNVYLSHPHCTKFCVLGGGACSVE